MRQRLLWVPVLLAFLLLPVRGAEAQLWTTGQPGDDVGSIAVLFGQLSPNSTFSEDGSGFESGTVIGASGTGWLFRRLGVRAHFLRGETEGNHGNTNCEVAPPCAAVSYQKPTVWAYGLEGVARLPMGSESFTWFPYISVGGAGKSYRWSFGQVEGNTSWGMTAAAGIELRPGATSGLGLVAEFRNYRTPFDYFGVDEAQNDYVFSAGLSINR
jgi:hypothetical protein